MKYSLFLRFFTALWIIVLCSCTPPVESEGLEWKQGWVRAMPPGRGMTAAYGELKNSGQETIQLVVYDSDAFESVGLHQSLTENGVSRMQEQGILQIAAGESVSLEPGGLHLMLMRANRSINAGDAIEIGVTTSNQRYVFTLPVEAR